MKGVDETILAVQRRCVLIVRGEEVVRRVEVAGVARIIFDALMINETHFLIGSTKGLDIVDHYGTSLEAHYVD